MQRRADQLREEAKIKFSPYWKKLSQIHETIQKQLHKPIEKLHKKYPNIPTFKQLLEKIQTFSMQKVLLQKGKTIAHSCNNVAVEQFFTERLQSLDEVKDHVLTKYIMKELFLYFIVSFLFFFMIFFVNQILLLAETILKKRVPVFSVVRLIWYSLPAIIAQSAPFATLVGFLMCLGRMVTDNEVLILRASGQRYITILKPVILMGVFISIGSFFVNDYLLPVGTIKFNKLQRQVIVTNPSIEIEPHAIKKMNDSTLVSGDVTKKQVSDLVFFDTDSNHNQRLIIAKKTDVLKATSAGVLMQLIMNDADVIMFSNDNKYTFDMLAAKQMKLNVFEASILSTAGGVSPREMTSFDLHKKIKEIEKSEDNQKRMLNSYKLEYNKKFSIPFGSFFFALLALPLALVFGKKDGQTLGLIFGLLISLLYWAATIIGQMFGVRSGYNGVVMMWFPNFTIGITGILLYFKLVRK